MAAYGLPRLSPRSRMSPRADRNPKEHSMADKKADLAGPGIGDYLELEKVLPDGLQLAAVTERDAEGALRGEALHRRQPLQRTQPDDGRSAADRGRRERRQRPAGPRRLAHADPVPHLQRSRQAPHQRAGGAGGHQVEENGAEAVRHAARRRPVHRHARRAQGLLPRSRPQRLRRPVGLGARDHARAAQPRLPERRSSARSGR